MFWLRPARQYTMPRRQGRVALARIAAPGAPDTTKERIMLLSEALKPGLPVSRYGRDWRLGGLRRDGSMFTGRIGFERARGRNELWDEERQDFFQSVLREGATSPFALNADSMIVAFQLRSSPQIKRTSFTGAFQAILREGSQQDDWDVAPLTKETTLDEFVQRVEVVHVFKARLLRPNPDFRNRDRVEQLIEGTNANLLDIAAQNDDGIELDDATVQQAIAHADDGHGHYLAKGKEHGNEVTFDSRTDEAPPEVQTPDIDPATGEVSIAQLEDAATGEYPEE
ncbi:MAG TPA: hypothetical protein VGV93_04355 [Acidimicrobiales bacterium]|nr:hypothetical protein [Acidimicrobiales bacterium]